MEIAWACPTSLSPQTTLSYTWQGPGLESVVTWTLTETDDGTHLRMEQTGFGAEHEQAYRGATSGWTRFLDRFEQVVADLDGPDVQGGNS